MKKRTALIAAVLVMLAGITAAVAGGAAPGSESDPLVSMSYVDSRTTYSTVQIPEGGTLVGGAGAEIILRSGEATAIGHLDSASGIENGVSDVTAGTDLMTGMKVELNHLLITPRDDGRGLRADTVIWVMVRGTYTVK